MAKPHPENHGDDYENRRKRALEDYLLNEGSRPEKEHPPSPENAPESWHDGQTLDDVLQEQADRSGEVRPKKQFNALTHGLYALWGAGTYQLGRMFDDKGDDDLARFAGAGFCYANLAIILDNIIYDGKPHATKPYLRTILAGAGLMLTSKTFQWWHFSDGVYTAGVATVAGGILIGLLVGTQKMLEDD